MINTSTPTSSGQGIDDGEGPAPKKVKFENHENGNTGAVRSEPGEQVDKDSDEDEEVDFEDAV